MRVLVLGHHASIMAVDDAEAIRLSVRASLLAIEEMEITVNPLIKDRGAYRQFEKRDKRKNFRS